MTALLSNFVCPAWIPLLQPLDFHQYWMVLLVPLTLAIALVYKTLKLEDLSSLMPQTLRLTATILAFMIGAAVLLFLLTELL